MKPGLHLTTHIHGGIHTYIHIYMYTYIYIYVWVGIYIYIYICTYVGIGVEMKLVHASNKKSLSFPFQCWPLPRRPSALPRTAEGNRGGDAAKGDWHLKAGGMLELFLYVYIIYIYIYIFIYIYIQVCFFNGCHGTSAGLHGFSRSSSAGVRKGFRRASWQACGLIARPQNAQPTAQSV